MQGVTVPRKPWISSEIIHTLAGRIGLVTVAPFAALCGAVMWTRTPHDASGGGGFDGYLYRV